MSSGASAILCVGALTVALGYATFQSGGGPPRDWNISLLIVGLAGVFSSVRPWRFESASLLERVGLWTALLFPIYVAFTLVPLPLWLLRTVSPIRAEVAGALGGIMPGPRFAPLSIAPSQTWAHLSRIVGYALIFLLVRNVARRPGQNHWTLAIPLITLGTLEAVWGLLQLDGRTRMSGSYLNPNHFAGLLEMVLAFALLYAAAVLDRGKTRRALSAWAAIGASGLLALAVAMFLAIGFSVSKMGMVSTLVSLVLIGMLTVLSRFSGWKRWLALTTLGIVAILVVVFLSPRELVEQVGTIASDQTTEGRLPIWKDGLHLIAAYPLFGSGLNTFYPGLLRYQTWGVSLVWPEAHNDYLQLLSELGFVGFLIPAVLMAAVFARALKLAVLGPNTETRLLALACSGGLAAMLIHSAADFNLYVPANAMTLAWISGLAAGLPGPIREREERRGLVNRATFLRQFALALGCVATVYAGASLIFIHLFRSDPQAEQTFCRFGICDTDAALEALQRQHGVTTVADVPPPDLLHFLPRDAAGPYRWCDLGASLQKAGRTAEARYCFSRALALAPRMPFVLSRVADFYFDLGKRREGLELMAQALEGDPSYGQVVFTDYDERQIRLEEILRFGLPDDPQIVRSYLRWQIEGEPVPDHHKIWNWIVRHRYADDHLAREYLGFLMKQKEPEAAWRAWALYAGAQSYGYPELNRIFNGGFESNPSGAVFDWKVENLNEDVEVALDTDVARSGTRSLRVQFKGNANVTTAHTSQTTFVTPGVYRFRAFVRTRDLTTDQGIAFQISDAEVLSRLSVRTEQVIGTNEWQRIEQSIQVSEGTRLLVLQVVRQPSLKFDSNIAGTAWIDDVSLTRLE